MPKAEITLKTSAPAGTNRVVTRGTFMLPKPVPATPKK